MFFSFGFLGLVLCQRVVCTVERLYVSLSGPPWPTFGEDGFREKKGRTLSGGGKGERMKVGRIKG